MRGGPRTPLPESITDAMCRLLPRFQLGQRGSTPASSPSSSSSRTLVPEQQRNKSSPAGMLCKATVDRTQRAGLRLVLIPDERLPHGQEHVGMRRRSLQSSRAAQTMQAPSWRLPWLCIRSGRSIQRAAQRATQHVRRRSETSQLARVELARPPTARCPLAHHRSLIAIWLCQ